MQIVDGTLKLFHITVELIILLLLRLLQKEYFNDSVRKVNINDHTKIKKTCANKILPNHSV